MGDDYHNASVASYSAEEGLREEEKEQLRDLLITGKLRSKQLEVAIKTVGNIKDFKLLDWLAEKSQNPDFPEYLLIIRALSEIGGIEAAEVLIRCHKYLPSTSTFRDQVLWYLGAIKHIKVRDYLIRQLVGVTVKRDRNDQELIAVLKPLAEHSIHVGSDILIDLLLHHPNSDVRIRAATALTDSTEPNINQALQQAALYDVEPDVRIEALDSMENRAGPYDCFWLANLVKNRKEKSDIRVKALRALVLMSVRFEYVKDGWIYQDAAIKALLTCLRDSDSVLILEAACLAHYGGEGVVPCLLHLVSDAGLSPFAKTEVCRSLGRLRRNEAVLPLINLLKEFPDAEDDEEKPLNSGPERVAAAAAWALARIDPISLLEIPGTAARHALQQYSLEEGALIFEQHVIDFDGVIIADVRDESYQDQLIEEERFDESFKLIRRATFELLLERKMGFDKIYALDSCFPRPMGLIRDNANRRQIIEYFLEDLWVIGRKYFAFLLWYLHAHQELCSDMLRKKIKSEPEFFECFSMWVSNVLDEFKWEEEAEKLKKRWQEEGADPVSW